MSPLTCGQQTAGGLRPKTTWDMIWAKENKIQIESVYTVNNSPLEKNPTPGIEPRIVGNITESNGLIGLDICRANFFPESD